MLCVPPGVQVTFLGVTCAIGEGGKDTEFVSFSNHDALLASSSMMSLAFTWEGPCVPALELGPQNGQLSK